jgi:hypothetical protein
MPTTGISLGAVALVTIRTSTPRERSSRIRSMPNRPGTKYGVTTMISRWTCPS